MLPLFDLAPGCVPTGQGVIVVGLVSKAEDRDAIPHRDGRGARLQALPVPAGYVDGFLVSLGNNQAFGQ